MLKQGCLIREKFYMCIHIYIHTVRTHTHIYASARMSYRANLRFYISVKYFYNNVKLFFISLQYCKGNCHWCETLNPYFKKYGACSRESYICSIAFDVGVKP